MNDQNRNDLDGEEFEKNDDKLIEKIGAILLRHGLHTANGASDRDELWQKATRILQRLEEGHLIGEV
jgi:hypothetical protein